MTWKIKVSKYVAHTLCSTEYECGCHYNEITGDADPCAYHAVAEGGYVPSGDTYLAMQEHDRNLREYEDHLTRTDKCTCTEEVFPCEDCITHGYYNDDMPF